MVILDRQGGNPYNSNRSYKKEPCGKTTGSFTRRRIIFLAVRGNACCHKICRFALLVVGIQVRIVHDVFEVYAARRSQFVLNPFLEGLESRMEQVVKSRGLRFLEHLHGNLRYNVLTTPIFILLEYLSFNSL